MHAPSRFGLAIPPAIRELLAEQPDHNAVDVHPEIGADRDGTPIDARLHLTVEEPLPGVLPTAGRTHQRDHLTHRLGLRIDAEIPGATSGWAASRSRQGWPLEKSPRKSAGKHAPPAHWPSSPRSASNRAAHPCIATRARSADTACRGASVRSRSTRQRSVGSESSSQSRTAIRRK